MTCHNAMQLSAVHTYSAPPWVSGLSETSGS
jgi:hypothetical protein